MHFKIGDISIATEYVGVEVWFGDYQNKTQSIILLYSRLSSKLNLNTFPRLQFDNDFLDYYDKVRDFEQIIDME